VEIHRGSGTSATETIALSTEHEALAQRVTVVLANYIARQTGEMARM
jgi:hypothetical protein